MSNSWLPSSNPDGPSPRAMRAGLELWFRFAEKNHYPPVRDFIRALYGEMRAAEVKERKDLTALAAALSYAVFGGCVVAGVGARFGYGGALLGLGFLGICAVAAWMSGWAR